MHEHSQVPKHPPAANPFKKPAFMRRLPMASTGDLTTASPALDTYVTRHVNVKCKGDPNGPKKVPHRLHHFNLQYIYICDTGRIPLVMEPYDCKQKMEVTGAGKLNGSRTVSIAYSAGL